MTSQFAFYILILSALGTGITSASFFSCPEEAYDANVPRMTLVQRNYPFTELSRQFYYDAYGDPCRSSLVGGNFGLNSLKPDLFDKTKLGQTLCADRCQALLTYSYTGVGPICNTSAASPKWQQSPLTEAEMTPEFNCHDLNLPKLQTPLDLYFSVPPSFTDELDGLMGYLGRFEVNKASLNLWNWIGLLLSNTQVKRLLNALKTVKQLTLEGSYSIPDLEASAIDSLTQFRELESFSLRRYRKAPEALDAIRNPEKLLHLELYRNELENIPSQLSRFSSLLRLDIDFSYNVSLNDLPTESLKNLEFALFRHTNTPSIGPQFLAKSKNLVLLDLTCNSIQAIAPDAFSDLSALRVLKLTGNPIRNLPSTLFHPLNNLQVLHLKGGVPESTSYGFRINYNIHDSNGLLYGVCFFKEEQEFAVLESIDKHQFRGLNKLEHLELTNHKAKLDNETFSQVADTLKFLNIQDMKVNNLKSLDLQKMCNLEQLILDDNPVGSEFITYEMFYNLHNLERLSIKNCNISRLTGPLFLLKEAGVRSSNYALEGLWGIQKQLLDENPFSWMPDGGYHCNLHTWKALERQSTAGVNNDCIYHYKRIREEIDLWKGRLENEQFVQCPRNEEIESDQGSGDSA